MKNNKYTTVYKPKGYNQLAKALPKKTTGGDLSYQASNQQMFQPILENTGIDAGPTSSAPSSTSSVLTNAGTTSAISAAGGIATDLILSGQDNPYNYQYGSYGVSSTGSTAAAVGGPIASAGASVLGALGTGLSEAVGAQDYNEYGVNLADEGASSPETSKGAIYAAGKSGVDILGQLEKDLEQGDWLGAGMSALGLSQLSGLLDYKDEQQEAKAKQRAAEYDELQRVNAANLEQINAETLQYNDIMYSKYGGKLPKKARGGRVGFNPTQTPIVQEYGGQLHSGPDEGVRVDANGNPTAMTGNEAVALTEKGEVSYNGYIFSDSIKYKK